MSLLDSELNLTLRPMRYPQFFDLYKKSIKNFWTTEELDFSVDLEHLRSKISPAEAHLVKRLVAFFATADNVVAHNLVISLYKHINSPEFRMFLGKQLFDEMVHVETYLLLVDNYIPVGEERRAAFEAYQNIPSVKKKADFCFKYMDGIEAIDKLDNDEKRSTFVENLVCFAACVEGLFFFGSFAYVYFLRNKGLLPGLATATNWVFRDESMHIDAAMMALRAIREEYPAIFNQDLEARVLKMIEEAISVEVDFCRDALSSGITGLSEALMTQYLRYVADQRLVQLGFRPRYGAENPFPFMILQDTQPLTNFFEKRVTEYQKGFNASSSDIVFDTAF